MIVRRCDKPRRKRLREMLKVRRKHPAMLFSFPLVGLCEVWDYDGWAWIFPGSGGVIRVDWFRAMRYVRRHI